MPEVFGGAWRAFCVIGRILRRHIAEEPMIDGTSIDPRKLAPVGRLGGPRYCRTHEIFALEPA